MRASLCFSTMALLLCCSATVLAQGARILVVTNHTELTQLTKKQIKQIYLEGNINVPVKPVNLRPGEKVRSIFNARIIGLTESRIQAYWAQMKFTGRASPPKELENVSKLVAFLRSNPGYIAYMPESSEMPDFLTVVYTLEY